MTDDSALGDQPAQGNLWKPLVSIAYNIRRIFILTLYVVVVFVLSQILSLWAAIASPSENALWAGFIIFCVVVILLGAVLIHSAIYRKKL